MNTHPKKIIRGIFGWLERLEIKLSCRQPREPAMECRKFKVILTLNMLAQGKTFQARLTTRTTRKIAQQATSLTLPSS